MKKITSVKDLPEWFFKRDYKKNLSDIEWYREIRSRQYIFMGIEIHDQIKHHQKNTDVSRNLLLGLLERCYIAPNSPILEIRQDGFPVRELTVSETIYLAFELQKEELASVVERYNQLLQAWCDTIEEMNNRDEQPVKFPYAYEKKLQEFVIELSQDAKGKLEMPILEYNTLGNPLLSYDRPLNGYPLTIDTHFDDKTILKHVKEWLEKTRAEEQSKAPRPFNQNDFDDWKIYKIREIWDLENWAALNDSKILDRILANTLWPHPPDDFSPIDVLRTTARKKAKEIFQFETVVRLYNQLKQQYGEKFLDQ